MGIFRFMKSGSQSLGLFILLAAGFSTNSQAANYDFRNNLPPTCERGQGNSPEVTCQSLILQWDDQLTAINQFRRVTVLGDASLSNAEFNLGGEASNMELIVNGDFSTGSGFRGKAILQVEQNIQFGFSSEFDGSVMTVQSFRASSSFTMRGDVTAHMIELSSSSNISGNLSATTFIYTGSGTEITGNLNAPSVRVGNANQLTGNINAEEVRVDSTGTRIQGDVRGNQSVHLSSGTTLEGSASGGQFTSGSAVDVTGNLSFSSDVTVASGSAVGGNIQGRAVSLNASNIDIAGNVNATKGLTVGSSGIIRGNATAENITMSSSSTLIEGEARAMEQITLQWDARIAQDAYAVTIENNGGSVGGVSYCENATGSTPVTCSEPANVQPDGFCSAFSELSEYGIIGTSGFTYGNNSEINGESIREPDDGLSGDPTTPTPSGELDSVAPGFEELAVDFPFELTGGTNLERGTDDVSSIPPGSYGRIATRQGGPGDNLVSFAGGSLNYEDTDELYYIEHLDLPGNPATVHFRQGIYFIEDITGGNQTFFTIEPGDKVIIHIGNQFISGNETYLNSDGSASQLIINMHPGTTINIGNGNQGTDLFNFNGLIYSPYANTSISLGNNNEIQGGILSAGTVDVGNNTSFTYTDEVREEITGAVGCEEPTGPAIERFQIIQPARILSCRAAPVRVVACANSSCSERFNGAVSVNLQASEAVDWQGGDLSGAISGTNATLNFSDGEGLVGVRNLPEGIIQLSIQSSDPTVASSTLCTANNCQTEFVSSGLEIETAPYTRAGDNARSIVRALDTASDGSCQPRLQNQNLPVSIELECRDPASCAADQTFTLFDEQGNQLAGSGATNLFQFDGNGELRLDHTYTDVGSLGLNAAVFLEETPAPESPPIDDPEITLFGSSTQSFYSIPYSLHIVPYKDGANFESPEQAFAIAGESFTAAIESRNRSGDLTPSFGNETISADFDAEYIDSTQPGPGVTEVGAAQLDTSATNQMSENGVGLLSGIVWDEVGELLLNARLGSYFSAPGTVLDTISRPTGRFSRFIPAYFELGMSSVVDANMSATCTELVDFPYTYLGQPQASVSFEVLARNAKGALTRNYTNYYYNNENLEMAGFSLLSETHGSERFTASVAGVSWNAGRFTFSDDEFVYPRRSDHQVEGPYPEEQLGLRITGDDEDKVDFSGAEYSDSGVETMVPLEGGLNLLYARLNLTDISGPENEALAITGGVQIYGFINNPLQGSNGATPNFQPARFDNCTRLNGNRFNRLSGPGASLTQHFSAALTQGVIADNQFTWQLDGTFDPANAELVYEYDIAEQPWLGFPWRTPDVNESPRATATFGQYRGNDRIIFWLERGL